jgi:hypothetical protein
VFIQKYRITQKVKRISNKILKPLGLIHCSWCIKIISEGIRCKECQMERDEMMEEELRQEYQDDMIAEAEAREEAYD